MRSVQVVIAVALLPLGWAGCTPSSTGPGDAGPTSEDGGGQVESHPDGGFPCGLTVCSASEVCCVDPATAAARCLAIGLCRGVAVTCDTTLGCPQGQVCCASFQQGVVVACSAQCTGPGNFQICASDAECPAGEVCSRGALVRACVVPFDAGFPLPPFDAAVD